MELKWAVLPGSMHFRDYLPMIFSAMPFNCPPVCTRKPANSELSFRHRAPVLHYDWCTQPHPSLVPSNTFCISTLNLPHSAMNCGRLLYIMNKPFGLQSNRMAGIAAFPTPASSPAMSSLPLPVEQVGPVFHAHCTHRPVACSSITVEAYCAATAERPAQRLPPWFQSTIYSHRSRPQTHIPQYKQTLSLDRRITIAYTTRARHSQAIS